MHNHNHSHSHTNKGTHNKAFLFGIILNVTYIAIEAIYGILFNSLALLADAGHNLSDVLGLIIAWVASYMVLRQPTKSHTYGFKKSSVLAALLNAMMLIFVVGGIIWEAIGRFNHPSPVSGSTVMIVAGIGFIINSLTAALFIKGKEKDINIKGAFMHMAADAVVSLGVVIAGLVIYYTDALWIDPLISIIIAGVIFSGTWGLLKESTALALDAVPLSVDYHEVMVYLSNLPGITEVHDLHIWAMSTTEVALTVHLVNPAAEVDDNFTSDIACVLKDKFGIHHSTIQIENGRGKNICELKCS